MVRARALAAPCRRSAGGCGRGGRRLLPRGRHPVLPRRGRARLLRPLRRRRRLTDRNRRNGGHGSAHSPAGGDGGARSRIPPPTRPAARRALPRRAASAASRSARARGEPPLRRLDADVDRVPLHRPDRAIPRRGRDPGRGPVPSSRSRPPRVLGRRRRGPRTTPLRRAPARPCLRPRSRRCSRGRDHSRRRTGEQHERPRRAPLCSPPRVQLPGASRGRVGRGRPPARVLPRPPLRALDDRGPARTNAGKRRLGDRPRGGRHLRPQANNGRDERCRERDEE